MSYFKISKGLDVPINGAPNQSLVTKKKVSSVALIADDYRFMKPAFLIKQGQKVKLGQPLFQDRRSPEIHYTAPATGVVQSIDRGQKRKFLALQIQLDDSPNQPQPVAFEKFSSKSLASLPQDKVKKILLQSGLWTALRERPFAKVADPNTDPFAIFITAIDTNPLAPDPTLVISKNPAAFKDGLKVVACLAKGTVHLCKAPEPPLHRHPLSHTIPHSNVPKIVNSIFQGPHPAGLPGTHIHFLAPVNLNRKVWYLGYQDVVAIGKLFTTGKLFTDRYVSLAGPLVKNPRIIKTQLGANLHELIADELRENSEPRIVSGSVLLGHQAAPPIHFLGRYHNQITVIPEDRKRIFHGFLTPGLNSFSIKNVFLSKLFPHKKFNFGTNTHGSCRSIVPIGSYEKVIPLNVEPTFLLRALLAKDLDAVEKLGGLELDIDDLALATYVCPGKNDFMQALLENLSAIQKELT